MQPLPLPSSSAATASLQRCGEKDTVGSDAVPRTVYVRERRTHIPRYYQIKLLSNVSYFRIYGRGNGVRGCVRVDGRIVRYFRVYLDERTEGGNGDKRGGMGEGSKLYRREVFPGWFFPF